MKPLFLIVLAFIFSPTSTSPYHLDDQVLTIMVTDESGHPLIGANVAIYEGDRIITIGITDINGRFNFDTELRKVNIRVSYAGYANKLLEGIDVGDSSITVELSPGTGNEEIFTLDINPKKSSKPMDISMESDFISPPRTYAPESRISSGSTLRGYTTEKSLPGSGQITAGEWNDLNNWKDWKKLISGDEYKSMSETWSIQTDHRYAVLVLNDDDIPLPGAKVEMLDNKGQLIWQSFTDVSGRAELFKDTYRKDTDISQIRINYQHDTKVIRQIKHVERGAMVARLNVPCPSTLSVDISWVVDATSSMSDEIMYLQSELLDVINRVKSADADIKWSSIFYRDEGDEYITRIQPFSSNPQDVLNFIKEQEAHGGGDFPEAVSDAVHQMTTTLKWRPESEIKICFLLLDAPPHQNNASMDKYRKSVQAAAAKGIKIIPITASGINRETEFLMKFTSILTNGTYVFITDDSGIGNPHLDPVVTDYEVEKLNDLLVRLIQSYTSLSNCKQNVVNTRDQDIRFYPNPASDLVNIENLLEGDQVLLISASGKIVKSSKVDEKSTYQMNINDLISGNYILRIKGENRTEDFRLLVIT